MSDASSITVRVPRRLAVALVAALAGLGLVGAGVAGGARLARPTSVAVVDLQEVIENLSEYQAMQQELATMQSQLEEEGQAMVADVQAIFERMQSLAEAEQAGELDEAGRAEFEELRDRYRLKDLEFKAWDQRSLRRMDWERSYGLEELYRTIIAEIEAMSSAGGWDVVLADDSDFELTVDRRQENATGQILTQLGRKRVLHAARGVDITQDLIDRMNNAWAAGEG